MPREPRDDAPELRALRDALWPKVLAGAMTGREALARLHAVVDFYNGRFTHVRNWGRI